MSEPKTTFIKDKEPSLEKMQEMVGGYIEMMTLVDGSQMIMNEEGNLRDLPENVQASEIAMRRIVGDVLILQGSARMSN